MSESSETESSEEFYDAEDLTPNRTATLNRRRTLKATTSSSLSNNNSSAGSKENDFIFPEPMAPISAYQMPGTSHHHQRQAAADASFVSSSPGTSSMSSNATLKNVSLRDLDSFGESRLSSAVPPSTLEVKPSSVGFGRQRFQDLRRCMQYDEDENPGNTLTPDSQNSSVEGIFPQRQTHPFRIIENDAMSVQSMVSLGRVGRILAGSIDASEMSVGKDVQSSSSSSTTNVPAQLSQSAKSSSHQSTSAQDPDKLSQSSKTESSVSSGEKIIFHEPDVIASTKLAHSKTTDSITSSLSTGGGQMNQPAVPVAPPRTRKKARKVSSSSSEQFNTNEGFTLPSIDKVSVTADSTSLHSSERGGESSTSAANAKVLRDSTNDSISSSSRGIVGGVDDKHSRHSLSSSSVNSTKPTSPSNSGKSNSAPGRASSSSSQFDASNQGLNLYKVIRGQHVVKPQDEAANKAPPEDSQMDRIERIRNEIMNSTGNRGSLAGMGTNSLGSATRYGPNYLVSMKERRKSAGDEDLMKQQLNIYMRTRTESGNVLTDMEILAQVPVKNLDTGEKFPLSAVEEKIPSTDLNPLSLHILRLTSHLEIRESDDDESVCGRPPGSDINIPINDEECEAEEVGRIRRKTAKLKRFFGSTVRKTVDKAKSIASEMSHARHKEDVADIIDAMNPEQNIKIKASSTNKGPYEFTKLQHVQDLSGEHTGAVWCMKFSSCGRLLATAGQDKVLRIWVLKDAYQFFQDMRTKYNADQKSSPTPSQESLVSHNSAEEAIAMAAAAEKSPGPFMPKSFCTYTGHTSDLLDVSWSKNYFVLSSSMDKTVRLWHISRRECLCCFQHIDFVTAIAFHPKDDRYFLSGSLDGKLRLWNIPDKKVALWNELDGQTKLITAANFCQNGKFAVVGSYDGRCMFYNTDNLKYHTRIDVRSSRGKNRTGRKISGIEPMPGEDKILVTSNDSRVRLYDLRDLNLSCKYKGGYLNVSSQIKASFSHDGKYIIAGSENQCIYIWKTNHDYSKLSSVRRDRSDFWEAIKAHNATVTCAIFAPHPEAIIKPEPDDEITDTTSQKNNVPDPMVEQHKKGCGYVLVSADFNGAIKVFINKTKPKHSSLPYTAID